MRPVRLSSARRLQSFVSGRTFPFLAVNACGCRPQRLQATRASPAVSNDNGEADVVPDKEHPSWRPMRSPKEFARPFRSVDLSFRNSKEAYRSKTTPEVVRAYLVFSLCSVKKLIDYNKQLLKLCRRVLGKRLFERLLRCSFYGHFVAGADQDDIKPSIERNWAFGVKSILDYSVEMDISRDMATELEMESCMSAEEPVSLPRGEEVSRFLAHAEFGDRRDKVVSSRVYFYADEAQCDANMWHLMKCIDAVLYRLDALFAGHSASGQRPLSWSADSFSDRCHELGVPMSRDESLQWFTLLDQSNDGIDLFEWNNLIRLKSLQKLFTVFNAATGQLEPLLSGLSENEETQMKNMLIRLDRLAEHAYERDVRLMIDAEQSYFQPAISRLTIELMRRYNRNKAVIFNTYQAYLREGYARLVRDLAMSRKQGFYFGAKTVRGAYMEQERDRALIIGYTDPINPTYEATTEMFHRMMVEVMAQAKTRPKGHIAVMVASHNEDTVRFCVEKMEQYGIHPDDRIICFGQLLGMSDQISFSLGQAGFSVYKYVPYGPVEEVLPYLSRRAMENRGVLKKVQMEKKLLSHEIGRRLRQGEFWNYDPMGSAVAKVNQ